MLQELLDAQMTKVLRETEVWIIERSTGTEEVLAETFTIKDGSLLFWNEVGGKDVLVHGYAAKDWKVFKRKVA